MSRILADGKKPEYWLLAKSRGQKLPLFFSKPEKKLPPQVRWEKPIIYITAPKEAHYDGGSYKPYLQDEVGQMPPMPPELTKDQKITKMAELNKRMVEISRQSCPSNQHPKTFKLNQEMKIAELQEQLNLITPTTT